MGRTMFREIFSRKTDMPRTPLDEAERAITSGNIDALAAAALKVARLVPDQTYLAEPLHEIGKQLARDASRIPDAVDAARVAARYVRPGSALEQQAVEAWSKHVEALPDLVQRMDAAKVAARHAGSALRQQAVSMILTNVEALPGLVQRVDAAKVAARHARPGSALRQQAVSMILTNVEALPDLVQRVDAAKVAARYARPAGSALGRQAVAKLREMRNELSPAVPTRAAATRFVQTFRLG